GFDKLLVVLGSEAHGLPDEISSVEGVTTIAIDMPGEAESLNVATAAAIAMYEISRP
ncbi:MAG: SpoU rRNA Methylase family, partial [Actinomycetota bacterium]